MIRKLPKEIINKIAAGEVIQRPFNVIKELVENAIDAEASSIRVSIRDGGIKLIEIADNGKGIKKEDFPLLCQRFATSKIAQMSDLDNIVSFGFRGEALASLSYVSDLQIFSKHRDEEVGHKCTFKDEKPADQPEPFPMSSGTKIKASNLFMSMESRRSSLSAGDEKKRIVKLISHFALHYHTIKFYLESEKGYQFQSETRNMKASELKMKTFQTITKLPYDKFTYLPREQVKELKLEGIITKLNTVKGKSLLLNVNNRIVQNPQIYRMVEKAYSECYQSIHQDNESYFVYMAVEVDPKRIDCNQHPAKKTIAFFDPDEIYQSVFKWVIEQIKEESSIKNIASNLVTKTKLTFNVNKQMIFGKQMNMSQPDPSNPSNMEKEPRNSEAIPKTQTSKEKPTYGHQKKRTDSFQMPLRFYIKSSLQMADNNTKYLKYSFLEQGPTVHGETTKKFFQYVTYVGCFNLNYIFIQMENRLYLMNLYPFVQSYVREWLTIPDNRLVIYDTIDERERLDLREMIESFLVRKKLKDRVNSDELVKVIIENRESLQREYGIFIAPAEDGKNARITAYPVLEKFMGDCLVKDELAYFLARLFSKAPDELQREQNFVEFIASFFMQNEVEGEMELSPMNDKYSEYLKNKVIPLLKTKGKDYLPQMNFTHYMSELLDLKDVYTIFERC